MAYPEEFGFPFVDHTHDGVTIRIVDIADPLALWVNNHYGFARTLSQRREREIREVLIHQHDGGVEHTGTDAEGNSHKASNGLPNKLIGTAKYHTNPVKGPDGADLHGMAYQFDIPYFNEIVDGKRIVYQGQRLDLKAEHTGGLPNDIGVGISLMGSLRNEGFHTGRVRNPGGGIPSEHQLAALPVLVHYLQERFKIANCHVQGHFQHNQTDRSGCPGYDTERWLLDHEDRERRFCYPINIGGGNTAPLLDVVTGRDSRCQSYMNNTLTGHSGFYPFGRRFFEWHNGVHLFPPSGENSPVYCVRDGWVIAARIGAHVVIDGRDYGSANFILIQHSDPGLRNNNDRTRSLIANQGSRIRKLDYFSLYMHLAPVAASGHVEWLDMLQDKDPRLYQAMLAAPEQAHRLDPLALPVKTGEVIGYVGRHDPFAARPADWPDPTDGHQAVLHFEMFSSDKYLLPLKPASPAGGLLRYFDPDTTMYQHWTISDTDRDALAQNALRKLAALPAFSGAAMTSRLDELEANVNGQDPRSLDSGDVFQRDPELHDLLSRVVTQHVSEWNAQWRSVLVRNRRQWGLTQEMIDHHVRVVQQFQWWGQVVTSQAQFPKRTSLQPSTKPFFYHPIRLLNWLNGLVRTIDNPIGYAHDTSLPFDPGHDFARYNWHWEARFPWTTRVL